MQKFANLLLACCWLSVQACDSANNSPADGAHIDVDGQTGDGDGSSGDDAGWEDGGGSDQDVVGDGDSDGADYPGDAGGDGDEPDGADGEEQDGGDGADPDAGDQDAPDGGDQDEPDGGDGDGPDEGDAVENDGGDAGPDTFVAVTFNTGIHPSVGQDGWTLQMNQHLDTYYGHGLCWGPAIDQARAFIDEVQPDVITFQEIFDIANCEAIPVEARAGFVCEGWTPDAPTVQELILGPGYQVACNWQKSDKCAAVKTSFGSFRGCDSDFCRDGLDGYQVPDCGSGSRIGRGLIDLTAGGTLTLVNVHGSSGMSGDDMACRVKQIDQVFVDLGDGEPAANGPPNLILGDFNTDPRSPAAILFDESAQRWNDFVGADHLFDFINDRVLTYNSVFCIDNMVSDELTGTCWFPGYTAGHPTISPESYFDHTPTVCSIGLP